jgi:hypothetical protein
VKTDREKFMEEFYQLSDFYDLTNMRDLIERACELTGENEAKVKAWVGMNLGSGEAKGVIEQLRKLVKKTKAWVVKDADGKYRIEREVFSAVVLNNNWEMDNRAWIVDDGFKKTLRTTTHNTECEMTESDLAEKFKETQDSLNGLRQLTRLMGYR